MEHAEKIQGNKVRSSRESGTRTGQISFTDLMLLLGLLIQCKETVLNYNKNMSDVTIYTLMKILVLHLDSTNKITI